MGGRRRSKVNTAKSGRGKMFNRGPPLQTPTDAHKMNKRPNNVEKKIESLERKVGRLKTTRFKTCSKGDYY